MIWLALLISLFIHPILFLGVAGFIVGGPVGAFVGAVIGFVLSQ